MTITFHVIPPKPVWHLKKRRTISNQTLQQLVPAKLGLYCLKRNQSQKKRFRPNLETGACDTVMAHPTAASGREPRFSLLFAAIFFGLSVATGMIFHDMTFGTERANRKAKAKKKGSVQIWKQDEHAPCPRIILETQKTFKHQQRPVWKYEQKRKTLRRPPCRAATSGPRIELPQRKIPATYRMAMQDTAAPNRSISNITAPCDGLSTTAHLAPYGGGSGDCWAIKIAVSWQRAPPRHNEVNESEFLAGPASQPERFIDRALPPCQSGDLGDLRTWLRKNRWRSWKRTGLRRRRPDGRAASGGGHERADKTEPQTTRKQRARQRGRRQPAPEPWKFKRGKDKTKSDNIWAKNEKPGLPRGRRRYLPFNETCTLSRCASYRFLDDLHGPAQKGAEGRIHWCHIIKPTVFLSDSWWMLVFWGRDRFAALLGNPTGLTDASFWRAEEVLTPPLPGGGVARPAPSRPRLQGLELFRVIYPLFCLGPWLLSIHLCHFFLNCPFVRLWLPRTLPRKAPCRQTKESCFTARG